MCVAVGPVFYLRNILIYTLMSRHHFPSAIMYHNICKCRHMFISIMSTSILTLHNYNIILWICYLCNWACYEGLRTHWRRIVTTHPVKLYIDSGIVLIVLLQNSIFYTKDNLAIRLTKYNILYLKKNIAPL